MSNHQSYRERIKIPVDCGDASTEFLTKHDRLVAIGYERIVIGARGPYIEFNENQIIRKNIFIPTNEMWRIMSDAAFYIEYRTVDLSNVKIYYQKKLVNYADYKIDYYYISPFDLKTGDLDVIVSSIKATSFFDSEKFF